MEHTEHTINEPAKKKIKGTGLLIQKAALVIVSDNYFGTSFLLEEPVVTLGRDNNCDICLTDTHISSRHCKIELSPDGHHYLEDMDSKNGTFLNTKKLKKRTQLYYHDRIVIGHTILRYYLEEKLAENPE